MVSMADSTATPAGVLKVVRADQLHPGATVVEPRADGHLEMHPAGFPATAQKVTTVAVVRTPGHVGIALDHGPVAEILVSCLYTTWTTRQRPDIYIRPQRPEWVKA
jgi:hypothetical protein